MKKLFKGLTIILSCFAMIMCATLFTGCNETKASLKIKSTTDLYGLAAMTTGVYAAENSSGGSMVVGGDYASKVVNQVDKYIDICDNIIGGKSPIKTEKQEVEADIASERGFTTKIVVTATDLTGKANYTLYFKETDAVNKDIDVDDPDEYELSTELNGVIIIDEQEIAIKGIKTVDEEGELELEFYAYLNAEKTKFIVFEYEQETDEKEYSYKIYNNGQLSEEFSFELEIENNMIETTLIITKDGDTSYFDIEQVTKKDNRYLVISYKEPGQGEVKNIRVTITNSTNGTTYTYRLPSGEKVVK